MTAREIVRAITTRHTPAEVPRDTPVTLGEVFWPIPQAQNLAMKFWPELFKNAVAA